MKNAALFHVLLVAALVFVSATAFAFEGSQGFVQTPDAWSQHLTFGGVKYNSGAITAGGAIYDATITSRTAYRTMDGDSDLDTFQYLRAKAEKITLLSGEVQVTLFLRAGISNEIRDNPSEFDIFKDAFDVERGSNSAALRLYLGNVKLVDVIPNTDVTAGRFYTNHLNSLLVDGGDAKVYLMNKIANVYGYYAQPVSHFTDNTNTLVGGLGFELDPIKDVKVRAEYTNFAYTNSDTNNSFNNNVFRIRGDTKMIPYTNSYLDYSNIDSVSNIEVGFMTRLNTRTNLQGSVRHMTDFLDNDTVIFINNFNQSLMQDGDYTILKGEVAQMLTEQVIAGVGSEGKIISGDANFAHRQFVHTYGFVDLNGLIHQNLYIQINGGYWFAPADGVLEPEDTFQMGGRVSYTTANNIDIWAGTTFDKYTYFLTNETFKAGPMKRFQNDSRSFYVGAQYTIENLWIFSALNLALDLSTTSSTVFDNNDFNNELDNRIEFSLNALL